MFDIGFWELTLIGVVALLVVGPDRLPGLARTAGVWVGRGRRFVSRVKEDIERDIRAEEMKDMLDKTRSLGDTQEILEETRRAVNEAGRELNDTAREADKADVEARANLESTPSVESPASADDQPATDGEKRTQA